MSDEKTTTGAMVLKLMEKNKALQDNINRLLRICGESGICSLGYMQGSEKL